VLPCFYYLLVISHKNGHNTKGVLGFITFGVAMSFVCETKHDNTWLLCINTSSGCDLEAVNAFTFDTIHGHMPKIKRESNCQCIYLIHGDKMLEIKWEQFGR